jgi:anti-sigma B factor antagonist
MSSATVSISSALAISPDLHHATVGLAGIAPDTEAQPALRLEGTFDALSAPATRPALEAVVNDKRSFVSIDLSGLRLIDSAGAGELVSLYKRVHAQGRRVSMRGLKGQPLAIFQLLRLDRLMAQ